VTTPSQLAFETVRKLTSLLKELKMPIIGIVENMKMDQSRTIQQQTRELSIAYLTEIPYDAKVEEAIGIPNKLLDTLIGKSVQELASEM
jgi:Mrp family chromosome partitioning ATPase